MADVEKPDSIVTGIKAVAEHFGKSDRQVRRWLGSGMPRLSQKRFDLLQVQAWLDTRQGMTRPAGGGYVDPKQLSFIDQGGSGKDFQEERLKKAKADLAEMEVKQRRAELVRRQDIEQLFVARIINVKQALLTFPRSLPPQLIHCKSEREMEIILLAAVRDLVESFRRPLPEALGGIDPGLDTDGAVGGQVMANGGR